MQIYVNAPIDREIELRKKPVPPGVTFFYDQAEIPDFSREYDAYIFLNFQPEWAPISFPPKPILIDSVLFTLKVLNLPANFHRINGWPGFLEREIWEVASNQPKEIAELMNHLGWQYILIPDIEGFITARVISQIINEAHFALKDNISSPEEIDTAMKLGTNYPFGPFEWSKKIGLQKIYNLLEKLSKHDERYKPAFDLRSTKNEFND